MERQELNGVRTAQELERKYDFSNIGELTKNIELQKEMLTKVENEMNDYVNTITNDIQNLQDQVDGNITTWFYSGEPTLNNAPANEWTTDDTKNNHLGDLYYDQNTGKAYRFSKENNNYAWIEIADNQYATVLAIANTAQDTADRKRQVFINTPAPPYDVGDLWIRNREIYRCQTSKDGTQTYEENDWIVATKYTDDTVANQVGANLTILSGTVTEIREDVDELSNTITNTVSRVDENGNKIGTLEEKTSETSQTVDEISAMVSDLTTNLDENYYTSQRTEELIMNVQNGLINRYSVGGGNNIFRNTGLYFTSGDYNSGFEFWEGDVVKQTNLNSKTQTSMILQAGILSQVQNISNGFYTVSFNYEILNPLATVEVSINDNETVLTGTGKYIKTIEINNNTIEIKFASDVGNSCEIYELMCNYGEIALSYSQNANEIKTDTVEISEGIKITSTSTDSIFRANATGIRTEDKMGNVITEFLDTGTKTKKIEANQGIIADLLIESVDGQTWITGLGR